MKIWITRTCQAVFLLALRLCFTMSWKKKTHTNCELTKSVDIQRCKRIKCEAESVLRARKTDISKIGRHDIIIGSIRVDTERNVLNPTLLKTGSLYNAIPAF